MWRGEGHPVKRPAEQPVVRLRLQRGGGQWGKGYGEVRDTQSNERLLSTSGITRGTGDQQDIHASSGTSVFDMQKQQDAKRTALEDGSSAPCRTALSTGSQRCPDTLTVQDRSAALTVHTASPQPGSIPDHPLAHSPVGSTPAHPPAHSSVGSNPAHSPAHSPVGAIRVLYEGQLHAGEPVSTEASQHLVILAIFSS